MGNKSKRKHYAALSIMLITIIFSFTILGCKKKAGNVSTNLTKSTTDASKLTYENFMKINIGDKLEDAVKLLGQGKKDETPDAENSKLETYTWSGPAEKDSNGKLLKRTSMNVFVKDGIIVSKSQVGINPFDAKITYEMYNKISNGMTFSEVEAILGKGYISTYRKTDNLETKIYVWNINKDQFANCTFNNGKVIHKYQEKLTD